MKDERGKMKSRRAAALDTIETNEKIETIDYFDCLDFSVLFGSFESLSFDYFLLLAS